MTAPFDPTFGIRDTSKNCKKFVKDNFNFFIYLLIPLAPFIFIADMINDVIQHIYPEPNLIWFFSALLLGYFNICLAVGWHRAVIWGTHRADRINPLNPDLGIFKFAGMSILYFLIAFIPGVFFGLIGAILVKSESSSVLPFLFIAAGAVLTIIIAIRISIIFPSVATEGNLRIRDAYALSKGYAAKLCFAPIWTILPLSLLSILYVGFVTFLYVLLTGAVSGEFFAEENITIPHIIALNIVHAPATVFVNAVLLVLGVTVLSNYYQWIMQKGNRHAT